MLLVAVAVAVVPCSPQAASCLWCVGYGSERLLASVVRVTFLAIPQHHAFSGLLQLSSQPYHDEALLGCVRELRVNAPMPAAAE